MKSNIFPTRFFPHYAPTDSQLFHKINEEGLLERKPSSFILDVSLCVLHLVNNSLECGRIVESQVGKHFAVDFDAGLVDEPHQLGVGQIFETSSGIDTLYPKSAEVALFVLAVAIGVCQTLFPSVLGNSPHILAAAIVATGEF